MNTFPRPRVLLAASLFAAAMAISGCTLIPAYERPVAPVPTQFPGAGQPGSSTTPLAADLAWRGFFTDERLKALIQLALSNNRDLRVAALNVDQSRAQYRITHASSFPAVNGSASYTAEKAGGFTSHDWSASVGTTAYVLDFFGRVRSLSAQALEQYLATEEARRSAQIALIAEVATQYFALREAEEQLSLAHQTLEAVEGSYQLNKYSYDAGEANELDLRTAEGQVQTARINVLTYERQLAQAGNALALLLGQPVPDDLPAARPFGASDLMADLPAGLPSDLVQHRPDILQAEHALQAANANIGAARAAFFPSISLTASVGTASPQLSGLFSAGGGTWTFLPQLNLPIFAGGANMATLDAARVSTRIEIAQYDKAIQTAFREVADALVESSTYAKQIDAENAAINAQQRRLTLANLRYRQGEDTYLNVLSAQQDLYSAQQGLLAAQNNRLASQIALYQALGGGWQ